MAKCQLEIKLLNDTREYQLGDTIQGYLEVTVDSVCDCKEITIDRYWRTHGKGNRDSGGHHILAVYHGQLNPGIHRFDFEFKLDQAPITYHGDKLNIDWYIKARADIPWAIDPKAEVDLIVRANPSQRGSFSFSDVDKRNGYHKSFVIAGKVKGNFTAPLIVSPFFIIALIFTFAGISQSNGSMAMVAGVFSFFLGSMVISGIKRGIAQGRLGDVKCQLNKDTYVAGDSVELALTLSPPKKVELNRVTMKLTRTETAVSGSGTNRRTHTKVEVIDNAVVSEAAVITPGGYFNRSAVVQMPYDAMHSFASNNNHITWHLNISLDIAKCPDWDTGYTIPVLA